MLTIYNRQKQAVGGLFASGQNREVADVRIQKRLNSTNELSFVLPMNSNKYFLLESEGLIECEGQKYIIKKKERKREGQGRLVTFTCPHIMRRLMDTRIPYSSAIDELLGANIQTLTNLVIAATGGLFTFFWETTAEKVPIIFISGLFCNLGGIKWFHH
ncbi:hypothetical protein OB236_14390 [Paenibacillus sp. WQ 127069]|uniref:Prophage endopeptidase tail N-terminal domain-containing protein n=1 Tax=Paenibacillus baimaensis TaxID=2982185 RepID=A0ABT2UHD6_9BACL|nr:hypothetical protein [Paenibacillus sp. WQ 127069]MCU6793302.1 hypothetical protein [Paenibacillus sp. WQ 127069]